MASYLMQTIREYTREMTNNGLPAFGGDLDPEKLRGQVETAQAAMPVYEGVSFESLTLGGVEAEIARAEFGRDDAMIMYMHGGGFVCGDASTSRGYASMLAAESRIPVCSFGYRLAPEHPFPAQIDDSFLVYQSVLDEFPDIPVFLIGESAGGNLALACALKARDAGIRQPAAIVLSSPYLDASGAIDRVHFGWDDITITLDGLRVIADCFVPDRSLRGDPYASPILADMAGLCPVFVSWDRGETLAADSEALVEKLQSAHVPVSYKRFEGCFHAFAPVGRNAPEGAELLDASIAFMLEHLHDQRLAYDEED